MRGKGRWEYLYRAVDREGQAVDFVLSEYRDIAAAKRFVARAIKRRGIPQKIILNGYAASHVAVGELQEEGILPTTLRVRTNRYLNNLIEQDLGRGKQRMRPALGDHATTTITGIELVY